MPKLSMMLAALVSSCAIGLNEGAVCKATKEPRSAHAAAMVDNPTPDAVVITGANLIGILDAGCGDA